MKQTNERLCALAQKGDATALDSLIDNNKSFIGKVANDLFRSMNLAQSGLNLDTDDLKQAGNLGLWKAVPKFDAARGMKFLTYTTWRSFFSVSPGRDSLSLPQRMTEPMASPEERIGKMSSGRGVVLSVFSKIEK